MQQKISYLTDMNEMRSKNNEILSVSQVMQMYETLGKISSIIETPCSLTFLRNDNDIHSFNVFLQWDEGDGFPNEKTLRYNMTKAIEHGVAHNLLSGDIDAMIESIWRWAESRKTK